jgi:PAS domain S-box-containing protein
MIGAKHVATEAKAPLILVVEDEAIIAKDIERSLATLGYQVLGRASSAEDGIRKARSGRPDLILMDIGLPGELDGINAAEIINRDLHIPVIFLSAFSDRMTVGRAKATEPCGYIVKPFKEAELRCVIEIALHKHRTDRSLREHEHWLDTTLRSISDGVIATDPDLRVVFLNPVAEKLTGWTHRDALGRALCDVFPIVEQKSETSNHQTSASEAGVSFEEATSLFPRSGEPIAIDGRATPIVDDSEQVLGTIIIFRDIRRRLEAEQGRAKVLDELRSAIRLRDEFFTLASHELKTPLAALALNTDVLARAFDSLGPSSPPQSEAKRVKRMSLQVRRFGELIERLLDVSSIVAGHLEINIEEVDLVALSREVIDRFESVLMKSGAPLSFEAAGCVLGHWDRLRLDQVLTNLLSNAMKYGAAKPIEVAVRQRVNMAVLTVRDHGIGIKPEDRERIFGRFERAVSATQYSGLGLGLWITRQIVEAMGGTISVESGPDVEGSIFTVELHAGGGA